MHIYDKNWAESYEQLAEAGIPSRAGLYRLCHTVLAQTPSDSNVLIVGCGTGADLIPLVKSFPGWTFDAIEPAKEMIAYCQRKLDRLGFGERVKLHEMNLESYSTTKRYDAITSVLVSQHLSDDRDAQDFFSKLHDLLLPGGWLFSAEVHIAVNQDRERMLSLWEQQALFAGTPAEIVSGLRSRFETDLRPRDEAVIEKFLSRAGFKSWLKPFSSLIYGAWCARKDT